MKRGIVLLVILTFSITNLFGWSQCRNTNGTDPQVPNTVYLGDQISLSCDAWAIEFQDEVEYWGRHQVVIHTSSDIQNGIYGGWSDYNNVENNVSISPSFTSTGTWYWGFQLNYNNDYGWYCRNDNNWYNMWGTPTSDLTLTVLELSNPSNLSTSPQSNSDIQINWTRWEERCVLIIRSLDNSFGTPVQGQTYSSGNTISDGANEDVVIYVGNGTTISGELRTITDTGLTTGETYYYKIYSENYSYYSDGEIINNSGDQSLPVTLSSFTASQTKGIVTLNWTTESETNNRGFNIYSSETENGNYTQINPTLIPGAGNSTTANNYSFTHKNVIAGRTYWYKLEDVSTDGKSEMHGAISVKIDESLTNNDDFHLGNCFPNPFNPVTTITYSLPEKSSVNIVVYDINGNQVKSLKSATVDAGNYSVQWDGTDANDNTVSAGIYFCKMITNTGFSETNKLVFVK